MARLIAKDQSMQSGNDYKKDHNAKAKPQDFLERETRHT
jgi:hypothetical protein